MRKDTSLGLAADTAARWSEYRKSGRITGDMLADPAFRDQLSLFSGVECDPDEDKTRQEDKVTTDINYLLARVGVMPRPVQYGEQNFDLDLHGVMLGAQELREGFALLPPEVQEKYGSFPELLRDVADGKVKFEKGAFVFPVEVPPVPEGEKS